MKTHNKKESSNEVVTLLQGYLVDLIGLSLQGKQAHWNVVGPLFHPLHEMFDKMVDEFRNGYDLFAERIRALGHPADGRLKTLASKNQEPELPSGLIQDQDAIRLILSRVETLKNTLSGHLSRMGELDLVTQNMMMNMIEGLDKQAWMLRSQMEVISGRKTLPIARNL